MSTYMQGISVIIPVLNRENYIGAAIKSVLNQAYEGPLEIIISDDGSTDSTETVAESFGKPVRVLRCPKGAMHGPAAARNRGIREAENPFIAFLDSDDIYLKGHLRDMERYLALNKDVAMVIDQAFGFSMDEHRFTSWPYKYPTSGYVTPEMILLDCFFPSNAVVLRRSILDSVGLFDEDLRMGEDHDLWLRIAEQHAVACLYGGGVAPREHASRSVRDHLRTYKYAQIVFYRAINRYSYKPNTVRKRRAVLAYRLAEGYIGQRNYLKSMGLFLQAALLDPVRSIKILIRASGRLYTKR